jgi:hypothetical protein
MLLSTLAQAVMQPTALIDISAIFLGPSKQIPGQQLKLRHDSFLQHTFLFIIQYHLIRSRGAS